MEKAWLKKEAATRAWQRARKRRPMNEEETEIKKIERNIATNKFKDLARESKHDIWDSFLNEVSGDNTLYKFWSLHRRMNRENTGKSMPDIQDQTGGILTTDEEKGSGFLARYITQTDRMNEHARHNIREQVLKRYIRDEVYENLITEEDVAGALRKCKNTAPGPE